MFHLENIPAVGTVKRDLVIRNSQIIISDYGEHYAVDFFFTLNGLQWIIGTAIYSLAACLIELYIMDSYYNYDSCNNSFVIDSKQKACAGETNWIFKCMYNSDVLYRLKKHVLTN